MPQKQPQNQDRKARFHSGTADYFRFMQAFSLLKSHYNLVKQKEISYVDAQISALGHFVKETS